ncbi:hypothetical protein ACFQ1M_15825 [Sungkyunkwania multivorans]|uniref:Uncharacterized protein n=1 Tax=Sungkyunkwania multivorans TaxID=1173618 RepID=A0ABW3D0U9_9FLAO
MKKVLFVITLILTTNLLAQNNNEIRTLEATFIGQSDKAYYFSNKESGNLIEFTFISKKASSKYDLNSKEHISKSFTVTYEIDPIAVGTKNADAQSTIRQYEQRLILIDIDLKESVTREDEKSDEDGEKN